MVRTKERWHQVLSWDALWIVVFVAIGTWALVPRAPGQWQAESIQPGSIAARDFVAPDDLLVLDEQTTRELRDRAREEILAVYDFDAAAADRLTGAIASLSELAQEQVEPPVGDVAAEIEQSESVATESPDAEAEPDIEVEPLAPEALLVSSTNLNLTEEEARLLLEKAKIEGSQIEERLTGLGRQVLERGVVTNKGSLLEHGARGVVVRNLLTGAEVRQLDLYDYLDYPDEVHELVLADLRTWSGLGRTERRLVSDFLLSNIGPNVYPNQSETTRRRDAAATAVESVYTRVVEGQVIVRKGDQIDERAAVTLQQLSQRHAERTWIVPTFGLVLFLGAIVVLLWLAVRREAVARSRRETLLGEALLLLTTAIVATRLCHLLATGLAATVDAPPFNEPQAYFFAIPFASLALVMVLLYGRALALVAALGYSMLAGIALEEVGWTWVVYCLAGSLAAILAIDHYQFKQRSVLMRAGAIVGAVSALSVVVLRSVEGDLDLQASTLGLEMGCAFASGILTAAAASFTIPLLESVFSLTTAIKLVELANTNLPLLRRVAFEAPGTFQHSLMVANLAKAGCEAIGADSVLAYTGGLYHDIGKIFRPDYFVENQRSGQNRHDKLRPSMSALIIINHVKEGLDLARDYHLPQSILDAIAQHHGTRLISYFYNRAKDQQDPESGEVAEEKFRYPGPKPHDKVMGVLMLADGVEAASRTLEDPSPARIRSLVRRIIDDCLDDDQLDETDLTLGDLRRVSDAFQRVLAHIHHRRLDYPGFDFNARRGKSPSGSDMAAVAEMAETDSAPSEPSSSRAEAS